MRGLGGAHVDLLRGVGLARVGPENDEEQDAWPPAESTVGQWLCRDAVAVAARPGRGDAPCARREARGARAHRR